MLSKGTVFHGREREFTGENRSLRREREFTGYNGGERDFTGKNGISREITGLNGRERDHFTEITGYNEI